MRTLAGLCELAIIVLDLWTWTKLNNDIKYEQISDVTDNVEETFSVQHLPIQAEPQPPLCG